MLIIMMATINSKTGMPIPKKTAVPAKERPNTIPGITKKTMKMYTIANQRNLAVVLPRHFAMFMGTFLIKGTGYHTRMPDMLKKSVNGYIRSTLTTPTPTNGVSAEVKMELDWTKNVNTAPKTMAR
eukprot:gene14041-biopygen3917